MSRPWNDDEEILLTGVRRGDEQTMKALYETYVGYLRGVCFRYVADPDAVKDLLQDSFIKIFTAIDSFEYRGKGSLRAWMTQVTTYQALSYLRSRRKLSFLDESYDLPDEPEEAPTDLQALPAEAIQEMIRELPTGYRLVFCLYALDGLSHKQVAEQLGIKEGTSASQYARARKLLAQKIKAYMEERGL